MRSRNFARSRAGLPASLDIALCRAGFQASLDLVLRRAGFAASLALVLLIALSLLSALFLDASLGAFRSGRASLAEARAATIVETALSAAFAIRFDTAVLTRPAGATISQVATSGPDSVSTVVQMLAPGIARVVVSGVARSGRLRAIAGRLAYVRLAPDAAAPGELALVPLGPNWWAAFP